MPLLLWRHRCLDGCVFRKIRWCPICRERAVVAVLTFDVHQSMAVYQYVYGLKPVGLHRLLAERLFADMRDRCARCNGGGLIADRQMTWWRVCPECEGTGGFWNRSVREVRATRLRVLRVYPDAGVPNAPSDCLSDRLRFCMKTNTVVEIRRGSTQASVPSNQPARFSWQNVKEEDKDTYAARPMRTIRPRPQPGYTNRGVCLAKVAAAFVNARRSFGKDATWKVKGNRHCRRVSLAPLLTERVKRAVDCWDSVCVRYPSGYQALFPLELVEKAAQILGVHVHALMTREF